MKNELVEALLSELIPIQQKVRDFLKNKDYLEKVYKDGANSASEVSYKVLRKVKKKIGFI